MSPNIKITDPAFDRTVSLREAYRIMERFVYAHFERGEASTLDLFTYLGVAPDGCSGDPAAFYDYLEIVDSVVADGSVRSPDAGRDSA